MTRYSEAAAMQLLARAATWRRAHDHGPKADAAASPPRDGRPADAASKPSPKPLEAAVLKAVIKALALHPRVAWAHRMNVGAFRDGDRYVRVGFVGCSDIIGQTTDGRFLAVEVKRPGGKTTDAQMEFLGRVQRAGGIAFVAWSVDDVGKGLL